MSGREPSAGPAAGSLPGSPDAGTASSGTAAAGAPPAPAPRARLLLALAAVAVALAAADTYVVVLALPDMMAGVGLGLESLQRAAPIISGFLLGYVAVLPLIGRLADLVDRRRVLLWCLAVLVLGSAITALAVELPVMVGGRVLQGLGGGGLVPATLALVADLWPVGRRGTPLGVVGGVQELGSVLGPLLGAAVLAVATWREIFWLNVVLGIVLAAAIALVSRPVLDAAPSRERAASARAPGWRRAVAWVLGVLALGLGALTLLAPEPLITSVRWGLPFVPFGLESESRVATPIGLATLVAALVCAGLTASSWWPVLRRADPLGALLMTTALGALVLTFASADPESEVLGPWGLWLLPVGALAVVLSVWRHRAARDPLVPRGVVRGAVVPALVVSLLVGVALVAVVVDVPLLARFSGADTQTEAALILLRFLVAVPVGAVLGGRLLTRVGPGPVSAVGLAAAAVGIGLMSRWDLDSLDQTLPVTVILLVTGLGIGAAIAPVNDAALAAAPAEAAGSTASLVVVARMVGMVVGLALLTAWGLHRYSAAVAELADPTDTDGILAAGVVQVQTVLLGAAICAALAAVTSLALGRRPLAGSGA